MEKVNTTELHLFDVFLNTNLYLSLVIEERENEIKVLNYNGSIYTLKKDVNSAKVYSKFKFSNNRIKEFFSLYPIDKLDFHKEFVFKAAYNKYQHFLLNTYKIKRLLLLL